MTDELKDEFNDLRHKSIRTVDEAVDWLFFVLHQNSLDKLDGIDEVLRTTFNNIYNDPDLRPVDRRLNFNVLVGSYEQYLKKLYFIINNEEVQPYHGPGSQSYGTEDMATLRNAIYAFECLRKIKDVDKAPIELKKYAQYLSNLKAWRNETAHSSPIATEQDVKAATHIAIVMYAYVTFCNISDLESITGN